MKRLLLTGLLFAFVLALPTQADFFQCVAAAPCFAGNNADVINGTQGEDVIAGFGGNDLIFGGDGRDQIDGDFGDNIVDASHDDLIFGGLDSDDIFGNIGNDTILPGPDDAEEFQWAEGEEENDTFIVLVGETVNCQAIEGNEGFDVVHLIGFGPYVAEYPFDAPFPLVDNAWLIVQDPIAGGFIFIQVQDETDSGVERINGLPTLNVAVLIEDPDVEDFADANCVG